MHLIFSDALFRSIKSISRGRNLFRYCCRSYFRSSPYGSVNTAFKALQTYSMFELFTPLKDNLPSIVIYTE